MVANSGASGDPQNERSFEDLDRPLETSAKQTTVATESLPSMWIRNLIWCPSHPESKEVLGSFREVPFDLEEDEAIDTAGLDVAGLARLLPARGEELSKQGSIVLDAVLSATQDEEREITKLLQLLCPLRGDTLLEHVVRGSDAKSFGEFRLFDDDTSESVSIELRSIAVPEFAFPGGKYRDPHIVTRLARILANEHLLLIFWGPRQAVPALPPPEGGGSGETLGLDLSPDPPAEPKKWGVWGDRGADAFDMVLLRSDRYERDRPLILAEQWLSLIAGDLEDGATNLEKSFKLWELDLHEGLDSERPGADQFAPLARFGALIGLLESIRADIGGPVDDPPYYFSKTQESRDTFEGLVAVDKVLEALRERLRDATALVSAVVSANALSLQQRAQERSERLQNAVTTISSAVLGPALIFGLFGANVHVPFEGSWWGFLLMVALAVLSVFAVHMALSHLSDRRE